ncbi:MAG: hypothetical protein ACYS8W_20580 [Planctomycetota bacterium]|jgi:hypothetical protein
MVVFRLVVGTIVCSAIYGFSIGRMHSYQCAARNLIKFPMLIGITAAICAIAYYMVSKFIAGRLSFRDVQMFTLKTYHDISVLLASLSPPSFFLACVVLKPTDADHLNEYPFFLGLSMFFIAFSGCVALTRRGIKLVRRAEIGLKKGVAVIIAWLAISLFAGAQCSWYLRPFFGISCLPGQPFATWGAPHITGATNFYEVVWHIVFPPVKKVEEGS